MARKCSRQMCRNVPVITLSYQYNRALVWLDDLTAERDPHAHDLCEVHSRRVTVPRGWRLEDRRDRFRAVVPNRMAG